MSAKSVPTIPTTTPQALLTIRPGTRKISLSNVFGTVTAYFGYLASHFPLTTSSGVAVLAGQSLSDVADFTPGIASNAPLTIQVVAASNPASGTVDVRCSPF